MAVKKEASWKRNPSSPYQASCHSTMGAWGEKTKEEGKINTFVPEEQTKKRGKDC